MKKTVASIALVAAFLCAALVPAQVVDRAVAYAAAAYRCTKCGKIIHVDPHDKSVDQACPDRGIHSWVAIEDTSYAGSSYGSESSYSSGSSYAETYECSKCGKVIHMDPHDKSIDQSCPQGGIHAWAKK